MAAKDQKVTFMCSPEERAMLQRLADADGRTVSDWIRWHARKAYEAQWGDEKPPRRRKR